MVIRFIVCLFFYWGSILIGHAQSLGLLDTSSLSIRTQADSVCKGQQAQLSVVSGVKAAFQWYREGKLLHTGSDYETPPLESTTTYEVYVFLSPESTPYTLAVEAFVFDSSAVKFDWSPRKIETPDAEVNFRLAPLPMAKSVIWDFGDGGVDSSFDANHTYQYPGTYKVAATIQWRTSCTQTVSQMLKVSQKPRMVFPSAFSPNGDGYNDAFQMEYQDLSSFKLQIFTRRGQLVYVTDDLNFVWQGKSISGRVVSEGLYICKVDAITEKGEKIQQRHVLTIIR